MSPVDLEFEKRRARRPSARLVFGALEAALWFAMIALTGCFAAALSQYL